MKNFPHFCMKCIVMQQMILVWVKAHLGSSAPNWSFLRGQTSPKKGQWKKKRQKRKQKSEYQSQVKAGQWKLFYPNGLDFSISDLLNVIKDTYQIDEDIGKDLCFVYAAQTLKKSDMLKNKTITLNPKKEDRSLLWERYVRFLNDEGKMERRALKLDIELRVNTLKGKLSNVILPATTNSFWWTSGILDKQYVMLIFYPMTIQSICWSWKGGHRRTEVKKQYEEILLGEHNVIIQWQVPNSPKSNLLDLGDYNLMLTKFTEQR